MNRKIWDLKEFDKVNLPTVVKTVSNKFAEFNGTRVLDMPIYMPGQGWAVPNIVSNFTDLIDAAVKHEIDNYGDFQDTHYVYITVDQKMVKAGKTGRRPGAHSDAYVEQRGAQLDITDKNIDALKDMDVEEVSHTYIAYDCLPTEFFNAAFPLTTGDDKESLKTFDAIADASGVITYPINTLLMMTPFVVHRCAICPEDTLRTFVKISISTKKYARTGNTRNDAFTYDWEMTARSPHERNDPWSK